MENKINIAELLKDCPSGMELDCTIVDGLYFDKVTENNTIKCYSNRFYESTSICNSICFYSDGSYLNHTKAKCVIFPKGKTTWEGFEPPCKFKDGDIVFYNDTIAIFKEWGDETLFRTYVTKYLCCDSLIDMNVPLFGKSVRKEIRLAAEEEKEKLFQAIKDNGYKWNAETKTIEKLPKFKVGDRIKKDKDYISGVITNIFDDGSYKVEYQGGGISYVYPACQDEYELVPDIKPKFKVGDVIQDIDTYKVKITEVNIEDECYGYESMISKGIGSISFSEQDNWELVPKIKPKFKVGDRVKKKDSNEDVVGLITEITDNYYVVETKYGMEVTISIDIQNNYELVPSKFDINTLKPFESKVLVRDYDDRMWNPAFWGKYLDDSKYSYLTSGGCYKQCIPYEGNEHLLGTTNDCGEFYKTW